LSNPNIESRNPKFTSLHNIRFGHSNFSHYIFFPPGGVLQRITDFVPRAFLILGAILSIAPAISCASDTAGPEQPTCPGLSSPHKKNRAPAFPAGALGERIRPMGPALTFDYSPFLRPLLRITMQSYPPISGSPSRTSAHRSATSPNPSCSPSSRGRCRASSTAAITS
jgi:hypothetical protein